MQLSLMDYRDQLLIDTLRYVIATIPFYKSFASSMSATLNDFPIMDSQMWAARENELVWLDQFPDAIMLSGGTVTDRPSVVFRCGNEYDRLIEHQCGLKPNEMVPQAALLGGFEINIWTTAHGIPLLPARGFPVANVALECPAHAWFIHKLISSGLIVNGTRVEARTILSSYQQLLMLSDFFWGEKLKLQDCSIKTIESNSFYTPQVIAEKLKCFWRAELVTKFGLTEFEHANMERCERCGAYHVGSSAFAEFFAPDRSGPVFNGEAVLVMTSLYPFVRVQPRIRYWTGDLFRLLPICSATSEIGLEFRGRAQQCVLVQDQKTHRSILTPIDVFDSLVELEHVRRDTSWYRSFLRGSSPPPNSPFRPGWLLFNIKQYVDESGSRSVEITIELDFDPVEKRGLAAQLKGEFLARLYNRCPSLSDDLVKWNIRLFIELVEPNGLIARELPITRV